MFGEQIWLVPCKKNKDNEHVQDQGPQMVTERIQVPKMEVVYLIRQFYRVGIPLHAAYIGEYLHVRYLNMLVKWSWRGTSPTWGNLKGMPDSNESSNEFICLST